MANSKARNTAYVSFDGRNQQELRVGDRSVQLSRKINKKRNKKHVFRPLCLVPHEYGVAVSFIPQIASILFT